jgi:hypothetical protein
LHPKAWFPFENWPKPAGTISRQFAGEVGVGPGVLVHVAVAVGVEEVVAVSVGDGVKVDVGVNVVHAPPAEHDALKTGKQSGPHAPTAGAPQVRNGKLPH